jgi:hypothetical protein
MTTALHRTAAADTVKTIAERLSDIDHVLAVVNSPDNVMSFTDEPRSPWSALSLSDGYPAMALLFAELTADDPGYRQLLHSSLSAGLADGAPTSHIGLFSGPASLAFAAHVGAAATGGYRTLLSQLDEALTPRVAWHAADIRTRIDGGAPVGSWAGYDIINGLSGVGRYLLARYEARPEPAVTAALTDVLSTLVATALADDVQAGDHRVPSWWVDHGPTSKPQDVAAHLNLGHAHGLGGPLALLASASRAGLPVPRLDEAIERIVTLLTRLGATDQFGPYWPDWFSPGQLTGEKPVDWRVRDAWCYGSAGIARAVYLAGVATGNDEWQELAHRALRAVITTEGGVITTFSLCHGWAGLLQIMSRMAHDSAREEYREAADAMAAKVVDGFDHDKPFGYHYTHPNVALGRDRPGFLEGAAGIALALHFYATGGSARTDWDAALLLT